MDKNKISSGRKVTYYVGMAMSAIGFLLFMSVFFMAFSGNVDLIFRGFVFAPIGMILLIAGGYVQTIGRKGLAGSGVILDPQQAREDLKPHNKAFGGMINDTLEEVDILNVRTKENIKVRCPKCKALNDEEAKFCDQCGAEL